MYRLQIIPVGARQVLQSAGDGIRAKGDVSVSGVHEECPYAGRMNHKAHFRLPANPKPPNPQNPAP